jgi:hypothetical protein
MAHPLAMKGMTTNRRVKTDWKDATLLADLMRMHSLPEGWIAPPETRELSELVRYRSQLSKLLNIFKNQIHAVMVKNGVLPPRWSCSGREEPPSSTVSSCPPPTSSASSPSGASSHAPPP